MKNNSLDIRIVADTQLDIFADLRIHKENNFMIIHDFLVENFHLDKLEMSSFFYSNDDWDKGEEITLMNMNIGDDEIVKFMESITVNEVFQENKLKVILQPFGGNYLEWNDINDAPFNWLEVDAHGKKFFKNSV